jgi:hypothetical protein
LQVGLFFDGVIEIDYQPGSKQSSVGIVNLYLFQEKELIQSDAIL